MPDGTGTTTYSYNPINGSLGAGMLASIDGPLSNDTITYRYDELGRVTNQAINNVGVNVTYDSIGRVTVMTNALGTFTNTYDTNTLMLTSVAYPNGQTMNLSYFGNDHDRRLQTIWNKKPDGTTISKFDYTYDSDGQIQTWQQELGGVSTNVYNFTYDPVDQLLHGSLSNAVTGALIKQFFYQYDTAGNRTAEQIDMASASASFNNLNQMISRTNGGAIQFKGSLNEGGIVNVAGRAAIMLTSNRFVGYGVATNGTNSVVLSATDYSNNTTNKTYQIVVTNNAVAKTLSYDLNGNLTNEVSATQTNTYEWDAADRMVARTSWTNRSEFTYDGMSRCVRIVEKTNGVVASDKRFVWCGMDRCEQRDSTGGTVTKRFFGEGEQINGANYYFTVDHLGSIREMADTSGAVRARYEYDPYGRRTKLAGDLEADFGFTGHYFHQMTGLYLTPFRPYNPEVARWLSRDPVGEQQRGGLYTYVGNNPINKLDPLGLIELTGTYGPSGTLGAGFGDGWGVFVSGNLAGGVILDLSDLLNSRLTFQCQYNVMTGKGFALTGSLLAPNMSLNYGSSSTAGWTPVQTPWHFEVGTDTLGPVVVTGSADVDPFNKQVGGYGGRGPTPGWALYVAGGQGFCKQGNSPSLRDGIKAVTDWWASVVQSLSITFEGGWTD